MANETLQEEQDVHEGQEDTLDTHDDANSELRLKFLSLIDCSLVHNNDYCSCKILSIVLRSPPPTIKGGVCAQQNSRSQQRQYIILPHNN